MENELRKIIKKVLFENSDMLSEIDITERETEGFEYHDFGREKQYIFNASNGFGYHLTFMKSVLEITDQDVINSYWQAQNVNPNDKKEKRYRFVMINFFENEENVNTDIATHKTTGRGKPELLMGNILWLWFDYMTRNPGDKYFAFAADDKRMSLYSNLFKNLTDMFYIFPKKRYDEAYESDQVLLIKKQ